MSRTPLDLRELAPRPSERDGKRTSPSPDVDAELVQQMRSEVAEKLAAAPPEQVAGSNRDRLADDMIAKALEAHARRSIERGDPPLGVDEEVELAGAVRAALFGYGRLERHMTASVTDIHVVGNDPVFLEFADGTKGRGDAVVDTDEELIDLARTIGRSGGQSEGRLDYAHPTLRRQLNDGSRFFAVAWITPRPHLFIRRHLLLDVVLSDLVGLGTLSKELCEFLAGAVKARLNILIAGAGGSGKTTLCRALAAEMDVDDRIVTIETEYELALDRFPERHSEVVALEAREANVEGAGAVSCADLVRYQTTMKAQRLVVGEVLGAEVIPMLNAMHSGAAGSMCTVHANSSADAFYRLGLMALQAPEHLEFPHTYATAARALDLVLFLKQLPGGRHVITSVREVTGFDSQVTTNEIFEHGGGGLATRNSVSLTDSTRRVLADVGYSEALW